MAQEKHKKSAGPRSAARLAAAQALYQLAMGDIDVAAQVVNEFASFRLGQEIEGDQYVGADQALFEDITVGAWDQRVRWDGAIAEHLGEGWSIERIDPVILGILRCGAYELASRPDVPTAVVINEYLDIAHAFYDRNEVSFVNGILDRLARNLR